ncbi:MAG: DMT family transporter [Myxococcales bacterium]|nr:DMT family transporter [Myxococcales bacterium]
MTISPRDARAPRPAAVHGALVLVQLAFASLAVFGKIAMRTVPPPGLALARMGGGALVFLVLARARGTAPRLTRAELLRLAVYSLLGVSGNQLLFLEGLSRTTATNASVLVATIPIFTVLVSLGLGREQARPALVLGIALALGGALWIVGVEAFHLGPETVLGDALILLNCAMYALYLVLVRDLVTRHGASWIIALAFAMGAAVALPFGAGPLAHALPELDAETTALVVYIVLVPTVAAYLANAWALCFARPSVVAIYIYLQPLAAGALAAWLLHERPNERALAGALAIFAGIALVTEPWARRRPPAAK